MKNIVIFGGTSAIAESLAQRYAQDGHRLTLLARNMDKLNHIEKDLTARGAKSVHCSYYDAGAENNSETINGLLPEHVDICVIAHGSLPDQAVCQQSVAKTLHEIKVNGTSVIALLTVIANRMEQQKSGSIAVISSVAGIRGRQSNYVYGAAKGLVSTFLQGLGQRMAKSNVHVLDIKPGFVDTPMTAQFKKGPLWAKPEKIAELMYKRIANKSHFSYSPFFWFLIMTIIKFIPTAIFNKLKL